MPGYHEKPRYNNNCLNVIIRNLLIKILDWTNNDVLARLAKRFAHRSSGISWEGVKSNDQRREVWLSDATRERRGKCLPSFVCRFVRHLAGTLAAAPNPRKLKYLRESLTGLVNNKPRGRISLHSFVIPRRGRGLSLPPSRESGTFLSFFLPKMFQNFNLFDE